MSSLNLSQSKRLIYKTKNHLLIVYLIFKRLKWMSNLEEYYKGEKD